MNYISHFSLIFLNETWISNSDTINLDINGYCSEHISGNKSRNTTKGRYSGGISIYYKTELKQYVKVIETNQYGIIWVKISKDLFSTDDEVFICHMYIPPNVSKVFSSTDFDFFDQLELDIVKYNDLGKVYISGDLNARTSDSSDYFVFDKYLDESLYMLNTYDIPKRKNMDRIIDYHGIRLLETCQATGLIIVNGRLGNDANDGNFTFCSHTGQSTVDYVLTNYCDFDTFSHFEVLDNNEFSDHAPILFKLKTKHYNNKINSTSKDEHLNRKIVWDKNKIGDFKNKLRNNQETMQRLTDDAHIEDVGHVVQDFTRFLHDTAFEVFGKTFTDSSYTAQRKKVQNEWFDENCSKARQDFITARNNFNRLKTDESRLQFTRTRAQYNKVRRKAKQKFRFNEGQRISKLAKSQPKQFWKNINKTYKKKQEQADTLSVDDLYNHFKSMFGEPREDEAQNDYNENDFVHNESTDDLDSDFTETEIREAIFSQKDNKSPGIDSLTSEILKSSYEYISPFLHVIYNRLLNTGEYPRSWGDGIISPIFKKGSINDASNYRGITLVNVLAKVYSQLLLNRITKWTEIYEKLTKNQFGFQKGKSITDCIFILHAVISKVLDSGQKLYCVFIDYEKCFDKIDRSLLFQKLLSENLNSKLVRAIKSMYTTVKSCVRYKSSYSTFFHSTVGLKQGDPSSPLLFMLFVNDILDNINSDLNNIFSINELKLFLILYADDQVVFATSPDTLQSLLNDIETYCNICGLKINTSKTKAMVFEKGRHTYYDFFIYGNAIELVDSFKYLGITFFKNGNWHRTQKIIAKHASFALHNLFTIFNAIELPVTQKCKLFDTLVASILHFGSEVWGFNEANDIENIHTKFLRRLLGVKKSTNLSALYGELGRYPLSVIRKIRIFKYWIKILKKNDTSLTKQIYLMLKEDADRNCTYNGKNWASQIKQILQEHGLGCIWQLQTEIVIPFETIKLRIFDNYKQKWYANINNSLRLQSYSVFKHNFELEKYLSVKAEKKHIFALTRFRTSSHNLFIETGRYEGTPRENRICKSCNMKQIESEYHFLLVCPLYRDLRAKYFTPYFCHWPNTHKFETLLSSNSRKVICSVAKFIYFAAKKRIV